MFIQYGVRLIGTIYLAIGVLGFVPAEGLNPFHAEGIGTHYLFNLIAINALHNLVHIGLGATALVAGRTLAGAHLWGKVGGVVLLLLFVFGMIQAVLEGFPVDQLLLGLVPLNSPGHMLHLVTGLIVLYLGLARSPASASAVPGPTD